MTSVKTILFGIGLIFLAIFRRIMGIGHSYSMFWIHYLPIAEAILGVLFMITGLFLMGNE